MDRKKDHPTLESRLHPDLRRPRATRSPAPPPVYDPHRKTAQPKLASHAPARPPAPPPVYNPHQKAAQPKLASHASARPPAPPPVYDPHRKTAQPKLASHAPARPPAPPPVYNPPRAAVQRQPVQRLPARPVPIIQRAAESGPPPAPLFVPPVRGEKDYAPAKKKGIERWEKLLSQQSQIGSSAAQIRKASYAEEFAKSYSNTITDGSVDTTFASAPPSPSDFHYSNMYLPDKGVFKASHNFKMKEEKLPNSEILYQQMVLMGVVGDWKNKKILRRGNVVNGMAADLIAYIRKKRGREVVCEAGTEDFFALLGTDNCASAPFLILDHGDDLEISGIGKIVITSEGHLDIYFT